MNSRTKRFLKLARKIAFNSTYRSKHGAVLARGSRVINVAYNKNEHCFLGNKFKNHNGAATLHAEIAAILGVDRKVTEGATLYVVRINKSGDFLLSEPCSMCKAALKHAGIKKVIYTLNNTEVLSYKHDSRDKI